MARELTLLQFFPSECYCFCPEVTLFHRLAFRIRYLILQHVPDLASQALVTLVKRDPGAANAGSTIRRPENCLAAALGQPADVYSACFNLLSLELWRHTAPPPGGRRGLE